MTAGTPAPSSLRAAGAGLAIFALALVVRSIHLYEISASPTFLRPIVDSETYVALATRLASGAGFGEEFFWQPPFYPLFLAAVRVLGGPSLVLPRVLQILLGAATAALTWKIGCEAFGRRAGLLAGAIVALYGPLVFFDAELLSEGWAAFWTVSLLLLFDRARGGKSAWLLFGLGVVGALSVLTRPTFLPFFIAGSTWLCLTAFRADRSKRAGAWSLALLLAGFSVVGLPMALLSRAESGRFSMLPASGGINLYIGNNPDVSSTISIRPGWEWESLTRLPARHGVERRQDTPRFFYGRFLDYVSTHPLGFAQGLASKSLQFVSSREIPRNFDLYTYRRWSRTLGTLVFKLGPFGFPFGLLLPLAVVGLVATRLRIPRPLLLFLLLYPAAVVLVFVSGRYRAPVVPALALVAGVGLAHLARAVRAADFRNLSIFAIALPIALLASLAGPFPQERTDFVAEMDYLLGSRALNDADPAAALPFFERAVARDPAHVDAHSALGLALSRLGRPDEAKKEFETALGIDPRSAATLGNLARLLAAQGDLEGAARRFRLALATEDRSDLRAGYGMVLSRLGDLEEAAHHLGVAAQVRQRDAATRAELGSVLRRLGRLDAATEVLSAALAIDGLHRGAIDELALVLVARGRSAEALAVYRAALVRARVAGNANLARHCEQRLSGLP